MCPPFFIFGTMRLFQNSQFWPKIIYSPIISFNNVQILEVDFKKISPTSEFLTLYIRTEELFTEEET